MANDIEINIAAKEDASKTIEGIGDASQRATRVVVQSMGSTEEAFDTAARGSGKLGAAFDKVSGAGGQLADGMSGVADGVQAVSDFQNQGARRADEYARKQNDVSQAMEDTQQAARDLKQAQLDLNQSVIDGKQSQLDFEQALADRQQAIIDAQGAQEAYNEAVKEHGKDSLEAKQALQDLTQANLDLKQAGIDADQAISDQAQATEDGEQAARDASQANIDAKNAQLDLNEAQRQAVKPTDLQNWAATAAGIAPIIMGVVAAVDLLTLANTALTGSFVKNIAAQAAAKVAAIAGAVASGVAAAAQWVWNIATMAFPVFLIIAAIALIVGGIVWLATKTTFFQDVWRVTWDFIKNAALFVWDLIKGSAQDVWNALIGGVRAVQNAFTAAWNWIKDTAVDRFNQIMAIPGKIKAVFSSIADAISAPFRAAFNFISRAWNNTIGRLSWSVPGWVPGIGGNSISAPKLPTFHTGGDVLRTGAAIVQRGERVIAASKAPSMGSSNAPQPIQWSITGDPDSIFYQLIMRAIRLGYLQINTNGVVEVS